MLNPTPALQRGRAAAEALMVDSCTVTRRSGESTDLETGAVTPTSVTVYSGRCKTQQGDVPTGNPSNVGEASLQLIRLQVHLPVSADEVLVDDVVTVTASALDPALVGRDFAVRAVARKTFLTSRRLDVLEVES